VSVPVDVGEALAAYLQHRPRTESRAVFMKVLAPAGPLTRRGVSGVVNAACARAGVPPAGAHRLRHTAATQMLRAGSSLPEIAQVLRHQQLKTTAVYAKVDHAALRTLALPWPEGRAA
jgi:integrase/recombinase XerD